MIQKIQQILRVHQAMRQGRVEGRLTVNEPYGFLVSVPIKSLVCRVSNGILAKCKSQKRNQDMATKSGFRLVSKEQRFLVERTHTSLNQIFV
jgi:hypothetical protein